MQSLERFKERVKALHSIDMIPMVLLIGWSSFLVGLAVLNPFTDSIIQDSAASAVLSEFMWGMVLTLVGLFHLAYAWNGGAKLRALAASTGAFIWGLIVAVSFTQDGTGTTAGLYAPFFVAELWVFFGEHNEEG